MGGGGTFASFQIGGSSSWSMHFSLIDPLQDWIQLFMKSLKDYELKLVRSICFMRI